MYRTVILPVILYGCEIWSLTLREGHRLKLFENRVLRKVFEPKMDEAIDEWRKLHNEELDDLYASSDTIRVIRYRVMKWVEHVHILETGEVQR